MVGTKVACLAIPKGFDSPRLHLKTAFRRSFFGFGRRPLARSVEDFVTVTDDLCATCNSVDKALMTANIC